MNYEISNIVFETPTLKHCDLCFHRRVCKYYKEEEHPVMHCRDYAEIKRVHSSLSMNRDHYEAESKAPGFKSWAAKHVAYKLIDCILEKEKDCIKFLEYETEKIGTATIEAEMDLIYGDCRGL